MSSSEISGEQVYAKDQVSVDISPENVRLITSIKEKMEYISTSTCIYRVPEKLCEQNPKAYIPEEISVGPFHRDRLKDREDQKWRYVYALLNRKPTLEANLDNCVKAIKALEHKARRCYAERIDLESDEFVKMMLIDGCFIIELLLRYVFRNLRSKGDPIFTVPGKLYNLRSNLILLENQIPLFIIRRLIQVVPVPRQFNQSFNELAFRFFRKMIPGDPELVRERFIQEGNHLLDLIHHCVLPTRPIVQVKGQPLKKLAGAKKLKETGIRFRLASSGSLLDIKLVRKSIIIPPLTIEQGTETLFRNLIALEQNEADSRNQKVTSYATLMHSIVGTERDAKLLFQKQILEILGDYEVKVSELFENLCKEVSLSEFYYKGLCESRQEHMRGTTRWNFKCPAWMQIAAEPSRQHLKFD